MLRERGGEDTSKLMRLLKGTKEMLEEICEIVEDMDGGEYGERGSYGRRGDSMGMRDDQMGMRRGYRVYQDDMEDYGERRRRDSRGRYM